MVRHRRGSFLGLLVLAAAVPAVQNLLFVGMDYRGAEGLSPQGSAVWPYDSYNDMRWLLVYHNSWATYLGGLVLAIGVRGLLSGALVSLAWPGDVPRPGFRRVLLRNLGVAAMTAAIVSPFAALAVAAGVVSLSWFVFASVGPMLLLAPFLQRAGVGPGWWRGLPSAALVGWSLLDFVVITVTGALVWWVPGWWTVLFAAACGAVNGLLWNRTVHAAVHPTHVRWRRVPVAPIAIVVALVTPLVMQGVTAGGGRQRNNFRPPVLTERLPPSVPYAVVVLGGHNSAYDGVPAVDPAVQQFSYAGLDGAGRPLPYDTLATHRSLESSADLLARQVDRLHARTGRPVALLGESEGAMVARTYLRNRPDTPVRALLMFSPLVRAARTYYPPPDADRGWGLAAGWQLRGIFATVNLFTGGQSSPDEPFIRSLLEQGPFYRFETMCTIPNVRVIAFLPTVSAAELPPGPYANIPVFEVPSLHGGLLSRDVVNDRLVDYLAGADINAPRQEYPLYQLVGAAWQAPGLAVTINPAWRPSPGPPFTQQRICQKQP
ncbi:hypothetical protein K7640_19290 [Micromonospora sp. PLK6-60]|uniref:hypothetical protein n=1 Tax=Micromonospora sp. PLK6-60 TaxID=2873383 RepID=UPI001CA60F5C|nr:hypothetical protein [Micromonospora sp. PLK6-60]MBY8873976.1 hypothetical protein [Micromonospora sp. PLK6-60]